MFSSKQKLACRAQAAAAAAILAAQFVALHSANAQMSAPPLPAQSSAITPHTVSQPAAQAGSGTATKPLISSAPAAPAVPSQLMCTAPAERAGCDGPCSIPIAPLANCNL